MQSGFFDDLGVGQTDQFLGFAHKLLGVNRCNLLTEEGIIAENVDFQNTGGFDLVGCYGITFVFPFTAFGKFVADLAGFRFRRFL